MTKKESALLEAKRAAEAFLKAMNEYYTDDTSYTQVGDLLAGNSPPIVVKEDGVRYAGTLKNRILKAIEIIDHYRQGVHYREVAKEIEHTLDSVRTVISTMRMEGLVERTGQGRIRLTKEGFDLLTENRAKDGEPMITVESINKSTEIKLEI